MASLKVSFLGPPRIERNGRLLELQYRKNVALLAYLAVTGECHTREALITLLWPELEPSRARAGLRRNLSVLRKALGEEWLAVDRETIGLNPDAEPWLDVHEFRQKLAACETHGHPPTESCPDCLPLLEDAVALYRDHFLAGFTLPDSANFDEFQFFQTEALKDQLASTLERLVRWHSDQNEDETAIEYARRWLALDPLHEPAHRHLMELYTQAGRRTAALRQYRACMRVLEEELGLPPSAETTALYECIRAERARPPEPEVAAPTPPSHTPTPLHPIPPHRPAFLAEKTVPVAVERPIFVARERELAQLDRHLEAALAGRGQVVFVTGGPGRGKTALMREFARRAMDAHPDLLVAGGNCNAYSGVGDAYLPFREVLGMLTGDVEARWAAGTVSREHARQLWAAFPLAVQALVVYGPSLIGTILSDPALLSRATAVAPEGAGWLPELRALSAQERAGPSDLEQSAIFHQFTNVLRTLAETHPLLLMLDDVQWADSASIGLLFHLGRRLEGGRILIACAYRPEEVGMGRAGERHPLEKVLAEFKRSFGDVWVDLRRADEREGRSFVDGLLGTESNRLGEGFRRAMFAHTGGHPLFTVEVLRAMQERGELVQDAEGRWVEGPSLDWKTLPARVEAVIAERVGRLDEELRDVLAVASVEGERFTAQVVARVQDSPEREVLRALSQELGARHRLVREGEEIRIDGRFLSRYQFGHALFQEYLYRGLSGGERRLLHGEIATALEELYGDQTAEIVAHLAHHYAEAGQTEKAIEYALRAGDQACLAYASEEATAHFHRALVLLDDLPLTLSRKDRRLEALRGLGQAYYAMGMLAEAEERLREAIALGQEMGLVPRELVRLYHWLGRTLWWQGRFDDRIRLGEEGLALLGDDVESVEAALMIDAMAIGYWGKGNVARFQGLCYRTAQLIERLPYSPNLGPAYTHIVGAYTSDKDVEEALKWLQTLEERATAHRDLRALGEAHAVAGGLLAWTGDLHSSVSRHRQGLELLARIGDTSSRVWVGVAGMTFLSLGDLQKAEEYAGRMLETARVLEYTHRIGIIHGHGLVGLIALCRGGWEEAVDAFQKAIQRFQEIGDRVGEARAIYLLGQAYLAQEERGQALRRFQEALALAEPEELRGHPRVQLLYGVLDSPVLGALSGLEEAYEDPEPFRAFCDRCRVQAGDGPFVQWYLEPAAVGTIREWPLREEFVETLSPDWTWHDPFDDCSFTVQDGLEIRAASGRDLRPINLSAPRVLRPVVGGWVAETVCEPALEDRPAIGGLVLWRDKKNYLRLDRGVAGKHEVLFAGCLGNQDIVIGRGRVPIDKSANQQMDTPSGRVFLRLERVGDQVDALCSVDGETWFTVGYVAFPVEDPVQVGLHAIGNVDHSVYHGAYPDGTAIRFESFQLWER